jgi:phospholipase D1/2
VTEAPILKPGENCWRIEHADRVAFLVDGQRYFQAFREAVKKAQHQLLILAWDIDSRFELIHDGTGDDLPVRVGDFLNAIVARQSKLRAYVLSWDFAMIFAMDREWLPLYKLDWKTHRRLKFRMDDHHPTGASHHQKVVVVDDAVAFCGGLDLTQGRWDTPEHVPHDPRRRNNEGEPLRPYHDVQIALQGAAAAALGDLARDRWKRAGHRAIKRPQATSESSWPEFLEADLTDVDAAIVRTQGPYEGRPAVREAERLYHDSIAAARTSIYIENQYFTAEPIADALAERLQEKEGPEVVLVLPLLTEGWLAQQSLDVIRVTLIRRLREADRFGRLAVYYPHVAGLTSENAINVHAKLMIIDDRFVRVGSSNLNNRSMGLDTECDIAIESGAHSRIEDGIASFRARLLAEHLGTGPRAVEEAARREGSLIRAIEELRGGAHSLWPLEPRLPEEGDGVLAEQRVIFDPEAPLDPEGLIDRVVPHEQKPGTGRRVLGFVALILVLLALAAAWRWTPLGDWLDVDALVDLGERARSQFGLAAVLAVGAYLLAGLLVVPLTILIVATGLIFGSVPGFFIAFVGANLSALLTYGLGVLLGRGTVRDLGGSKVNRVSQALARRGILTVVVLRIVPVAPFTVINLVAGASHIRFAHYLLGTVLGMAPGMIAVIALTDRVAATLRSPDLVSIGTLALVALAIVIVGTLLTRKLLQRSSERAEGMRED